MSRRYRGSAVFLSPELWWWVRAAPDWDFELMRAQAHRFLLSDAPRR
ncbi:hypothetical protein AGRA3207_006430 [Actinomadura graeca]|uniref:Uncharacterized protein n=1 Tax=Actinomadura graeca TaxID=2750812 RepID=A0ABX8R3Z5_9ACTN|nr:hypothetical protein [Actinomadura graeca]QXJ24999.1 hypothetical protein AGRA3207_006430 [Actinomadura graeca]